MGGIVGTITEDDRGSVDTVWRHAIRCCCGGRPWNGRDFAKHIAPKLISLRIEIVGAQIPSEYLARLEPEIDRAHTHKAAHQQAGTYSKHHGAGNFRNNQCGKWTSLRLTSFRASTVQARGNIDT